MNPFWHCWWLESNLVQFVEKPWGENNQRYFVWRIFFFCFAFWWIFLSCKYYDVFFIIIIISFLLFWLIDHLVNQCAAPAPLHLHSYQKPPNFPNELLSSLFLYQVVAQNWHFHPFLYMAKKTQLCQVSQYTELPYQCCMECIMDCWTKDKTFRFLTIQIQIIVCLKNTGKKRKRTKRAGGLGPVLSWLLNRWMNSVEGVLCCMGPSVTMPA